MIVVDLICEHSHRFEGWFAHSDDVESQKQRGLLVCAICGSRDMRRLPSAPHIQHSGAGNEPAAAQGDATTPGAVSVSEQPAANGEAQHLLQLLVKKLQETAAQSEDVGDDFPVEARRIHFGDAEDRAIRGQATAKDVASLLDEGINVLPMPIAKEDLH